MSSLVPKSIVNSFRNDDGKFTIENEKVSDKRSSLYRIWSERIYAIRCSFWECKRSSIKVYRDLLVLFLKSLTSKLAIHLLLTMVRKILKLIYPNVILVCHLKVQAINLTLCSSVVLSIYKESPKFRNDSTILNERTIHFKNVSELPEHPMTYV